MRAFRQEPGFTTAPPARQPLAPAGTEVAWSKPALATSALLHGAVALAAIMGLPFFETKPLEDPTPPVIMVDLATIAEKTNPPPPPPRVEAPKPEPKPEPPKVEQAATPPPPPPPPQTRPEPPAPPPPKPAEAEPEPIPAPKPRPEPPKVAEAPPPPPPETKVVPRAKPTPPQPTPPPAERSPTFDPNRLSALLNKAPQKPAEKQPTPPTNAPAASRPVPQHNMPTDPGQPMTISEVDAIRQQYERCWSPPVGARDAGNLIVRVRVQLNPDGSLNGAPTLLEQRSDSFWVAAADSVRRAVIRCSPLQNLPPTKFERWKVIDLTFNPKEMLG